MTGGSDDEPDDGERADPRFQLLVSAARQRLPVLLVGETGTGKSRLARLIHQALAHQRPASAAGSYVALNMAAVPESVAEPELFGSYPGAYTGAVARLGRFHLADGGTLFLDELHRMPRSAQAKLLLALEPVRDEGWAPSRRKRAPRAAPDRSEADSAMGTYHVVPLGAPGGGRAGDAAVMARLADPLVRTALICATTSPEQVEAEILHRVAGLTHRVRPLREEREVIPARTAGMLADAVVDSVRRQAAEGGLDPGVAKTLVAGARARLRERHRAGTLLSADAREWLLDPAHTWPGNSRQLRALVNRAYLQASGRARAGGEPLLTRELLVHAATNDVHLHLRRGHPANESQGALGPAPSAATWLDAIDSIDLVAAVERGGNELHVDAYRARLAAALVGQLVARGRVGVVSARKVVDALGLRARAVDLVEAFPALAAVLAPPRQRGSVRLRSGTLPTEPDTDR